jgi:hypothetical protein
LVSSKSSFFLFKTYIYFLMLTFLDPVLFAFYTQRVLKFKCKIPVPKFYAPNFLGISAVGFCGNNLRKCIRFQNNGHVRFSETVLILSLLMSYIHGATCKVRKFNFSHMDLRLATLKAVSFYLLHNVPTLNQCRKLSCATVVCKHFASYQFPTSKQPAGSYPFPQQAATKMQPKPV